MKLVYMGTPDIARVCLEKLHTAGFDIAAVYTKPDTPKNRGMKMMASEVKQYAESVGLPVIQPVSFRDDAVVEELRAIAPDLIVVVAYGKILPQRVLDIPKFGWMDRQCRPFRCRVRSVLSVAIGAFSVCPESIPVDRPIL